MKKTDALEEFTKEVSHIVSDTGCIPDGKKEYPELCDGLCKEQMSDELAGYKVRLEEAFKAMVKTYYKVCGCTVDQLPLQELMILVERSIGDGTEL